MDSAFKEAVCSARVAQELSAGGITRKVVDVSNIPGADKLPRALVVLLENVVRNAGTDQDAVKAAWRVVSAGTYGSQGDEIEFMPDLYVRMILWGPDDEFPPSSQMLFSDNWPLMLSAEGIAGLGDIVISAVKNARK